MQGYKVDGCSVCALTAGRSFSSGVRDGKWSRNVKYFSYLYSCTLTRPHFELKTVNDHVLRMTPKFPKRWRWAFHDVDQKIHTIYNPESQIRTLMNHADKYRLFSIPSCLLQTSPVHHRNEPLSRLITSHGGLPLIRAFKAPEGSQAWYGAFVYLVTRNNPPTCFTGHQLLPISIQPSFHIRSLLHATDLFAPSLDLNPSYLYILRLS